MPRKEYKPGYISPQQALEKMRKAGVLEDIKHPEQKLRKLLESGEIKGEPPAPDRPRDGWAILESSLEAHLSLEKMTAPELRAEVKRLIKELEALKKPVESEKEAVAQKRRGRPPGSGKKKEVVANVE